MFVSSASQIPPIVSHLHVHEIKSVPNYLKTLCHRAHCVVVIFRTVKLLLFAPDNAMRMQAVHACDVPSRLRRRIMLAATS